MSSVPPSSSLPPEGSHPPHDGPTRPDSAAGREYPASGREPGPGYPPSDYPQPGRYATRPASGPGLEGYGASQDDRTMAVVTHVIPLVAMFISVGWLGFVGPLIIWFIYRDRSSFVRRTAAGAFNFTVTMWLANLVAWICLFTIILIPVAILLWVAAFVVAIIFHIQGAIRANRGELYTYPLQIPILR